MVKKNGQGELSGCPLRAIFLALIKAEVILLYQYSQDKYMLVFLYLEDESLLASFGFIFLEFSRGS